MILTANELNVYLLNAGFKGTALSYAQKIVACESSNNTNAHNTSGEDSRGLFQINVNVWQEYKNLNLFDAQTNCNVAYQIYLKAGRTFRDWSCAKLLNLVNPGQIYVGIGIALLISALYISTAQ